MVCSIRNESCTTGVCGTKEYVNALLLVQRFRSKTITISNLQEYCLAVPSKCLTGWQQPFPVNIYHAEKAVTKQSYPPTSVGH